MRRRGTNAGRYHAEQERARRDEHLGYTDLTRSVGLRCLTCGRKFNRNEHRGHQPPVRLMRQYVQRGIEPPYPPVVIRQCANCNLGQGYQLLHDWRPELPPMADILAGRVVEHAEVRERAEKELKAARRAAILAAREAAEPEIRARKEARDAAVSASHAAYMVAVDTHDRQKQEAHDLYDRQERAWRRWQGRRAKVLLGVVAAGGLWALLAGADPRWVFIGASVFLVGSYLIAVFRHPPPASARDAAIRRAADDLRQASAARAKAMRASSAAAEADRMADDDAVEREQSLQEYAALPERMQVAFAGMWLNTLPPDERSRVEEVISGEIARQPTPYERIQAKLAAFTPADRAADTARQAAFFSSYRCPKHWTSAVAASAADGWTRLACAECEAAP